MRPDIFKRVLATFFAMAIWTFVSGIVIAIFPFYPSLAILAVICGIFFLWAGAYEYLYAKRHAVISRLILLLSGVVLIWAVLLMPISWLVSGSLATDDALSVWVMLSIVINICIFVLLLFLPIFLLQIKPGQYYLISGLGKYDHDFEIEHVQLERERRQSDAHNPGALIGTSRRRWIRPTDTACLIWDSRRKVSVAEVFQQVPMQQGFPADIDLQVNFTFDPQKITKADFAMTLSQQKTINDVDKLLQKITGGLVYKAIRNFYYTIPYRQASNPQIVQQLGLYLSQHLAWMEGSFGLKVDANSVHVKPLAMATAASAQDYNYFYGRDVGQFQQITYNARRGDDTSRVLLYIYLLEHPDLRYQFLPDVGDDLRLTDVDYLLQRMEQDSRFKESMLYTMLNSAYYMNALPPPTAGGMLPAHSQWTVPAQVQYTPQIEPPHITASCTNRGTVLLSWQSLSGQLQLHFDGQTVGPFINTQDTYDTGRERINSIDYIWNGQRYSLGPYSCKQPAPRSDKPPTQSRRRFGPRSDAIDTHRNPDGSYEPE